MNLDDLPPPQLMWEGKFVRALKRDKWEYASRTNNISAVVIHAEYEGKVILVDQPRVPPDCRCIELPAGLVGDNDPGATVESTAIKELEEETGFTAERVGVVLAEHFPRSADDTNEIPDKLILL